MDDALYGLLTAVLDLVEASGVLGHQIETRMLLLLGAPAQHLATTSFRLFPTPEVVKYIEGGLSVCYQDQTLRDLDLQMSAMKHYSGIFMLAIMLPYYTWQRHQKDPQGLVPRALAPLVAAHWSIAYTFALLRAWIFGSTFHTALYQLAAGRNGTYYGLFILIFMFCN